jgi:hypothetical protein
MFVNGSELNEEFYKGPSNDASYQVSIRNGGVQNTMGFNLPYRGVQFSIRGFNIPWM